MAGSFPSIGLKVLDITYKDRKVAPGSLMDIIYSDI